MLPDAAEEVTREAATLKQRLHGVEVAAACLWAMLLSVLGLSESAVVRAHVPIFRTVDKKLDWVLLQFPLPGDGDSSDDVVSEHKEAGARR